MRFDKNGKVIDVVVAFGQTLFEHSFNIGLNILTGKLQKYVITKSGANQVSGAMRLASVRVMTIKDVDGRVISGPAAYGWAKFHMRKPFPKPSQKIMGGEDEPHLVDDFNGEIESGYGKGRKKLLYSGNVVIKIKGNTPFIAKANIHEHKATRAGKHYDFVAEGIKPGTKEFEVNIPSGEFKGRYAFRQPKGFEDDSVLIIQMKDEGVILPKPRTSLKDVKWLDELNKSEEKNNYITEWKPDGGLAIGSVDKNNHIVYTSWREQAPSYYNKLPAIEYLKNNSRFISNRLLFKPDFNGTIFYVELFHQDGASRVGGILNSGADKAIQYQQENGPVEAIVWDIYKYKGEKVYGRPYEERRAIYEQMVGEMGKYNSHISAVRRDTGGDYLSFYLGITKDKRGLPFSEGVMVKSRTGTGGDVWYKVKHRDFVDCKVVDIIEGEGKRKGSVGRIVVEAPGGARGEVGSFQCTDRQLKWMWDNRNELVGQVAEISTQGRGPTGRILKGVFYRFHPTKSTAALLMYALDDKPTMYALKSAAGWRKK